ncbi:MAG: hypothetical protein Q8Q52_06220 [Acidimicrobiia bacterium]|nr:hypothetical protein [Acidimicrobiia bacterium]
MTGHEFTLIVEGPDLQDDAHIEALFEAGFGDAAIGRVGSIQYVDFDREAETFADAVFSATEGIEAVVPEARVVRLEPDDLVTMSEIAERTERTRESVRLLITGDRGPGGFPAPATHFRNRQRMWQWQEVAIWFAEKLGKQQVGDPGKAQFITAFNAGLKWRQAGETLPSREQQRIRHLVG